MIDIVTPIQRELANRLRGVLATYQGAVDLVNIGAYVRGSNDRIDYALKMIESVNRYLRQAIDERVDLKTSQAQLEEIFKA